MAKTAYEKYLANLNSQKFNRPELDVMNRQISILSEPFTEQNRQLQRSLNMDKASIGAKILATTRGQMQIQDLAEQQSQQTQDITAEKNATLNTEIAKTQLAIDQEAERKKAEKQAKNTAILRGALQAAGAVAGGLLTLPAGGMGAMAGASLGGAAGQALGGLFGIDTKGHITADPEQWDTGAMVDGIQQAGSILNQELTSRNIKQMNALYTQNIPALAKRIETMSSGEAMMFMAQYQQLLNSNDVEGMENFIKQYSQMPAVATSGTIVNQPQPLQTQPVSQITDTEFNPVETVEPTPIIEAPTITPVGIKPPTVTRKQTPTVTKQETTVTPQTKTPTKSEFEFGKVTVSEKQPKIMSDKKHYSISIKPVKKTNSKGEIVISTSKGETDIFPKGTTFKPDMAGGFTAIPPKTPKAKMTTSNYDASYSYKKNYDGTVTIRKGGVVVKKYPEGTLVSTDRVGNITIQYKVGA